ncbi:MAG: response regulator receiver protein [Bacteroidetes bacterium]|nr:response regulator receiver protein [Bacteroidota bacterium]
MIFIIDDDKEDLELITTAFDELQANEEIKFFEGGLELLEFIKDKKNKALAPSYIITDLKMPAMDGINMVEKLREHPDYQVVPIVMLSTSNLIYDIERAYKAGVNCYLIKPDTFSGWKSTVSTIRIWVSRWYKAVGA